jgi:hypothetical protein
MLLLCCVLTIRFLVCRKLGHGCYWRCGVPIEPFVFVFVSRLIVHHAARKRLAITSSRFGLCLQLHYLSIYVFLALIVLLRISARADLSRARHRGGAQFDLCTNPTWMIILSHYHLNDILMVSQCSSSKLHTRTHVHQGEVNKVMEAYGIAIDARHLMLLADLMTYKGEVPPSCRFVALARLLL